MRTARIDLYKDSKGKWRWRYISSNGRVLADSGQGYRNKADALSGLQAVTGSVVNEFPTWTELFPLRRDVREVIEVRVQP